MEASAPLQQGQSLLTSRHLLGYGGSYTVPTGSPEAVGVEDVSAPRDPAHPPHHHPAQVRVTITNTISITITTIINTTAITTTTVVHHLSRHTGQM